MPLQKESEETILKIWYLQYPSPTILTSQLCLAIITEYTVDNFIRVCSLSFSLL